MQNWSDLYGELADKITENIPDIRWVDLWHNQINFLEDEHPFPTPAVFLNFRSRSIEDQGLKVQNMTLQVDFFLYYETFSDTYHGAFNGKGALAFLNSLNDLYALFHGTDGENYSSMRRIALAPVDTGNAGNLYQLTMECNLIDYSAMKKWEDGKVNGIAIENTPIEIPKKGDNLFKIRYD